MRWAGYVTRMGGRRSAHMPLAGRTDGKSPQGRPTHRQDYNNLLEVGWESMKWIVMVQDTV